MSGDLSLLAILATPLMGLFLGSACGRWPNLRESVTLITAVARSPRVPGRSWC